MVGIWEVVVALLDDFGFKLADTTGTDQSYLFCDRYGEKTLAVWNDGKCYKIYSFEDSEITVSQQMGNGCTYSVDIDFREKDSIDRLKEIIVSGM